jgi:hypothetical protein
MRALIQPQLRKRKRPDGKVETVEVEMVVDSRVRNVGGAVAECTAMRWAPRDARGRDGLLS